MAQYSKFSAKEYFIPSKADSKSEKLRKIVFMCSVVVFILSLVQLFMFLHSKGVEEGYQQELLTYAPHLEDAPAQTSSAADPAQSVTPDTGKEKTVQPWAQKLLGKNKDVVGWISIPTHTDGSGKAYIDTAVVKGKDNNEYLYLNIDRNYSMSGSLFADAKCELTKDKQSDNITVYGHHMGYIGTGLTHIHEYKSGVDFLKKNPVINFNTIYDSTNQRYAVVGCFISNAFEGADNGKIFKYWNYRSFKGNKKNFDEWITNVRRYSWYSSSINCTENDDYITLSTCSNECWGIRWVVVAKKLTANDDLEKITESYTAKSDKDIYFPAIWVNKYGNKKVYYGWDY